jgi:hypothetical protein
VALRDQAALDVADIIAALRARSARDAKSFSPQVVAALLYALDFQRRHRGNWDEERAAFKRVAELAPHSAQVHAVYASVLTDILQLSDAPPKTLASWRAEAKVEAQKAVSLDPHDPWTHQALIGALPREAFLEREALLTKALEANPDAQNLLWVQGNFLLSVGRIREGGEAIRRVLTTGTSFPSAVTANIFILAGTGRYDEAEAMGRRQARLTPTNNSTRRANLFTALLYGPPNKGEAAIDQYQTGEPRLEPAAEKAWRGFVAFRLGKLSAAKAAAGLTAASRAEYSIDPTTAMSAYAMMGRLDEAFAEIETTWPTKREFYLTNLFEGGGANMRRDPRFMPLMARLGLVDYWTKSGKWPDFCLAADAPYDCKAEAAKAARP